MTGRARARSRARGRARGQEATLSTVGPTPVSLKNEEILKTFLKRNGATGAPLITDIQEGCSVQLNDEN